MSSTIRSTRPTRSTLGSRRALAAGAALSLALTLAACGSDTTSTTDTTAAASSSTAATNLVLEDGWVKAVEQSEMGGMEGMDGMEGMGAMTAMFGMLTNPTDREITITGGSSPAAGLVEIHEVVPTASGEMQMQPKAGGVVVPAGGTHELKPGADHVMLMKLTGPLEAGSTTTVTLTTSEGDLALTVPVRTFTGGEESYEPSPSPSMSHS